MNCELYNKELAHVRAAEDLSLTAQAHLNACENCAKVWREDRALDALLQALPRAHAPLNFTRQLETRLDVESCRGGGASFVAWRTLFDFGFVPNRYSMLIAACFVCVFSYMLFLRRHEAQLINPTTTTHRMVVRQEDRNAQPPASSLNGKNSNNIALDSQTQMNRVGNLVAASRDEARASSPTASVNRRRAGMNSGAASIPAVWSSAGSAARRVPNGNTESADLMLREAPVVTLNASSRNGFSVPLDGTTRDRMLTTYDRRATGESATMLRAMAVGDQPVISRANSRGKRSEVGREQSVW